MKPVITHPDLVQQVFKSIRDAICDGHFRPGERLNQDDIAEMLDVSRQPVVQAIHLLKSQGFARDTGRRGVEVTELGSSETNHYYLIRAALDGLAAREAALRSNGLVQARGAKIIEAGRRACESGSHHTIVDADMAFHQFIYELSGNPVISKTVTPLWHQLRRIMGTAITADYPVNSIWDEHQTILDAIIEGNTTAAENLARAHGETAARRVEHMLRQHEITESAAGGS